MDSSVPAPVAVIAMLVIRTALVEIRRPGSAGRQWSFLPRWRATTAGVAAAVLVSAVGWQTAGFAGVAWAVLVGSLVAYVVDLTFRADSTDRSP
ncbi:hypothetical protein ACOT81_27510 [Streptomyces sp. WI04-05B]|uniref:hypothetical protein n=1 Tax=Streptomyces TaxID=1883 RepID=UPI0029AB7E93|nr:MULTISPECIES: hypothetical protein [unclassified Streptomyces]MDX2546177.1 hypothetical protein [Streptomyces sp. WI04-05B]MDX2587133.1 hypothetical protein [Streptomyces sp. WI04-05A]MDX3750670.1 hypothetical protein [Streptomyces sp. AK08-02]